MSRGGSHVCLGGGSHACARRVYNLHKNVVSFFKEPTKAVVRQWKGSVVTVG